MELKYLAAYLPFGLKVKQRPFDGINELKILDTFRNQCSIFNKSLMNDIPIEDIIPILRPLSDLTKLIEVNKRKFVPMIKLLEEHLTVYTEHVVVTGKGKFDVVDVFHEKFKYIKSNNYNIKYTEKGIDSIKQLTYDDSFYRFTHREVVPENRFLGMSYRNLDNMLLEWHFDVFGLIPKGLAIDINTLE